MSFETCSSLHQVMNFVCTPLEPGPALQLTPTATSDRHHTTSELRPQEVLPASTLSRNLPLLPWERAGLAS